MKKLAYVSLLSMFAAGLAGCGSDNGSSRRPDVFAEDAAAADVAREVGPSRV